MLFWGNLGCLQHGLHLRPLSLHCAVGTGMLHVGSFKPCNEGEICWGNSNLDLQKPGSQMPTTWSSSAEAEGAWSICCADLACFLLPPCALISPLLSVLSCTAAIEVVHEEPQVVGVSTTGSSTTVYREELKSIVFAHNCSQQLGHF